MRSETVQDRELPFAVRSTHIGCENYLKWASSIRLLWLYKYWTFWIFLFFYSFNSFLYSAGASLPLESLLLHLSDILLYYDSALDIHLMALIAWVWGWLISVMCHSTEGKTLCLLQLDNKNVHDTLDTNSCSILILPTMEKKFSYI